MVISEPQPQPEAEQLQDFDLADSFINFDYDPYTIHHFGSASPSYAEEPEREPEPEPDSGNSENLGCCNIEEGLQLINLVSGNAETSNEANPNYETESSFSMEEDKKNEDEIEEGEIVDSDAFDDCREEDSDDDDVDVGDNNEDVGDHAILPSVPPVNVTLEPHHQMRPLGVVSSIVGAKVIVEAVEKHDPLNEGSILWLTESRTPLGLIDEIFGPVRNPYYVVRYNSENEVPEGIHQGTLISFVPEFANHVLNNKDLYKKGYDASGPNDEELSDEAEFSDDEKEAEYMRMQKITKGDNNDQSHGERINIRKKVPAKEGSTLPTAPAPPLRVHGHVSPYSGIGKGVVRPAPIVPPFRPANAGRPNLTASGVWTKGRVLSKPQSAMLHNVFPTNAVPCFPGNTQISHQFPVPGIPFQQQLNPSYRFPPAPMFPGVQPNILAPPMYAQGFVGQNQMTFGLSSPFPQIPPPMNFNFSSIPGNQHAPPNQFNPVFHHAPNQFNPVYQHPHQFNPRSSADSGRKTFHHGGRRGWRPTG